MKMGEEELGGRVCREQIVCLAKFLYGKKIVQDDVASLQENTLQ